MSSADASESRRGWIYGASAYGLWGLFPLYLSLLAFAGAFEVLAHRIVWSLVVVAILLRIRPRPGWWSDLRRRPRALVYLTVGAVVIGANWGIFVYAVLSGHVVEGSLGYFINPLFTVLIAVFVLRERLNAVQWAALALAGLAVVVLTIDYGRLPWIALGLAGAFGIYGLCKKKADVAAVPGLAVETVVLAPLALGYLVSLEIAGGGAFGHTRWLDSALLAGTGLATAVPLLFFAGAATRIPLSLLGLLQYIGPTLQFALGVFVFHEAMPASRLLGFSLVWLALAIFTWDGLRRYRRQRRTTPPAASAVSA